MLKTYATKAHNAMPEEAGPLHILGMWCYRVAEVNIAARAGAAALYKALPSATFEEVRHRLVQRFKHPVMHYFVISQSIFSNWLVSVLQGFYVVRM